ncbi:hypothetical protein K501DRAFT_213633 [Backusella circina FSU 941]|nr:hypothetical protein K501DRAFT_213633 [Backusella circina FSU 941]
MKVVHTVIVKFKPEVTEEQKEETIKSMLALKDAISEIIHITAGKTFTDRSQGFEWGWVLEFEKKEDIPVYAKHQAHLDFEKKYKPTFADLIAVDFES